MKDINQLAAEVHQANIKWWQNIETGEPIERNRFELLALVISEISECMEGERKNLMDDHLPHRKMAEVELADAKICLLDYAVGFKITLTNGPRFFIPANKGHALFRIMQDVANIDVPDEDYSLSSAQVSHAIGAIESYAEKHGYDIDGALKEKMIYNAVRHDHTQEARKLAGGKQF